jgi:hypothetical protein
VAAVQAHDGTDWVTLYEELWKSIPSQGKSRVYSVPLNRPYTVFKTNQIRLELDCRRVWEGEGKRRVEGRRSGMWWEERKRRVYSVPLNRPYTVFKTNQIRLELDCSRRRDEKEEGEERN